MAKRKEYKQQKAFGNINKRNTSKTKSTEARRSLTSQVELTTQVEANTNLNCLAEVEKQHYAPFKEEALVNIGLTTKGGRKIKPNRHKVETKSSELNHQVETSIRRGFTWEFS
jgi:hypothetical protein